MVTNASEINPFDIVSGKVAINKDGEIFYFNRPGNNMRVNGTPRWAFLHRINGPAAIWADGDEGYFINGAPMAYATYKEMLKCMKI